MAESNAEMREQPWAKAKGERWSCSHDGYHPGNRPGWCEWGCGSDYNQMFDVTDAYEAGVASRQAEVDRLIEAINSALGTDAEWWVTCRKALEASGG